MPAIPLDFPREQVIAEVQVIEEGLDGQSWSDYTRGLVQTLDAAIAVSWIMGETDFEADMAPRMGWLQEQLLDLEVAELSGGVSVAQKESIANEVLYIKSLIPEELWKENNYG